MVDLGTLSQSLGRSCMPLLSHTEQGPFFFFLPSSCHFKERVWRSGKTDGEGREQLRTAYETRFFRSLVAF